MTGQPPGTDRIARLGIGTAGLGGTPPDGDFARLLEAASVPAAHRLGIDPSLAGGIVRAPRRGLRRPTGPRGAEAAVPSGPRVGARPPYGAGPSDAADGARPTAAEPVPAFTPAAAPGHAHSAATPRTTGPSEAPVVSGDALPGPPDLVGRTMDFGRGVVGTWARRPLRDRLVSLAFALVALWIVLTVVLAALAEPGDAVGALIVIALSAFFVLRGLRRQRPASRDRP